MALRSVRVLGVLVALLIAAPATQAQVFNPTTFTLDNGLEVVVVENHRAPIVTHMVWYKVGAADEPVGKSGIAHVLEHLMFKGTKTRAPGEFSAIIARNGGRENAFTAYDYTGYFQTIAVDRLGLMMELEADRMTNLVLTPEVFEPELQVILEERSQRVESDPSGVLGEQVRAASLQNHPYRLPVIGWEHEIRGLTLDDAIDFYRRWYAPNNAILVVVGDVDPVQVRALAERHYGPIPAADVPERRRPVEPPQRAARRVLLEDPRAQQPSWNKRYVAPSYTSEDGDQAYALQVLAELLGGGSSSRLFRSLVVEQALAASAGAWYQADFLDLGNFGTFFSPRPGVEVGAVEAALTAEVERLLADGVTEQEVARAKQRLVDSAIFARDSIGTAARALGAALASGQTVDDVESWPARIDAVTVEQVNAAARAVLRDATSTTGVLMPART